MIRAILSAILGYAMMVALVISGIAATWYGLGNRFAFEGDTHHASLGWSLIQLGLGFVAAFLASTVAIQAAGPNARLAVGILLSMLFLLGILTFVLAIQATPAALPEGKTIDDLTFVEAGQFAQSPPWYHLAIVIVGCLGVLVAFAVRLPWILAAQNRAPK